MGIWASFTGADGAAWRPLRGWVGVGTRTHQVSPGNPAEKDRQCATEGSGQESGMPWRLFPLERRASLRRGQV